MNDQSPLLGLASTFYEVSIRLPNEVLFELFLHPLLKEQLVACSKHQFWWYKRVDWLLSTDTESQRYRSTDSKITSYLPGDWRDAHRDIMEHGIEYYGIAYSEDYNHSNLCLIRALYEYRIYIHDAHGERILEGMGRSGSVEVLDYLRSKYIGIEDKNSSMLVSAAGYGNTQIVSALLSTDYKISQENYGIALSDACYEGYEDVVQLLLQKRLELVRSARTGRLTNSAIEDGYTEVALLLLPLTIANPPSTRKMTVEYIMRCACSVGDLTIAKLLLEEYGADPRADEDYLIKVAIEGGHTEVMRLLLSVGAVLSEEIGCAFRTCALANRVDLVRLLFDTKCDVTKHIYMNLISVARVGTLEMLQLFASYPGVRLDYDCNCTLRIARKFKRTEMVDFLLTNSQVRATEERVKNRQVFRE